MRHIYRMSGLALLLPFVSAASQGQSVAPASTAPARPEAHIVRLDPALDALIAPGTVPEKIAGGFQFTEGPLWHEGQLWFEDEVGHKTFAMTADGKLTLLLTREGGLPQSVSPDVYYGPNGMTVDRDGSVLMCEQDGRRVVRLRGPAGAISIAPAAPGLSETFEGKRFNSPNDLVFAPDGTLWFTDPPYGLKSGNADPAKEIAFNAVYRYKDGKLTAPIRDLNLPNGIALSPDGKTLYVNNSGPDQKVMQYDIQPDGTVANARVLIAFPHPTGGGVPDGMKIDARGNIWTTAPGGIRVITPEGNVLGQIVLPETASNLAWGGDESTLYITARSSIYRVRTLDHGEMPVYASGSQAPR